MSAVVSRLVMLTIALCWGGGVLPSPAVSAGSANGPVYELERSGGGVTRLIRSGDDLQAALNAAVAGEVLTLEPGATFSGNFVLPAVAGTSANWITVRSASSNLPDTGTRVAPTDAASMAKIVSPNILPAISTVSGSQYFRFVGLEISTAPNVPENDGLVLLGSGAPTQNDSEMVPGHFMLDRCYIHGNTLSDAKRGVALNCASAVIKNSYLSDFHAVGFDTQAIAGWNGPGPFQIENNYIEASGENLMFGGADPSIPNLIPSDIQILHNSFSKPMSWKDGILAKVGGVQAAGSTQINGSLLGGVTYYYRVVATTNIGSSVVVNSPASDEVSATLVPGQNAITLSWNSVPNATSYTIFRTTDSTLASQRTWLNYSVNAPETSLNDQGANTVVSSNPPPNAGTVWSVKNLLELKNALRVTIRGNILENNWLDAQTGYAIEFKSVNQNGTAPWSNTSDVSFTENVVRNVASGINVQGHDPHFASGRTSSILVRDNLFYGIDGSALGGEGTFLKISDSVGIVVDHNTVIQSGNIITAYGATTEQFSYTNNITPSNTYGIKGDGTASGNGTLTTYFPSQTCQANIFSGANPAQYPPKNFYPANLSDIGFVDIANNNFRLSSSSPFKGAGTNGTDVGANIDRIVRFAGLF